MIRSGLEVAERTRVVHATLEHCMLALDLMYDADAAGTVTTRVRQEVPLGHVDPRSLSVQQRPPAGPSALSMKTEPWRVVLSLRNGSIRTDFDRLGRRFTTYDGTLDLVVSDPASGFEIAGHLQPGR